MQILSIPWDVLSSTHARLQRGENEDTDDDDDDDDDEDKGVGKLLVQKEGVKPVADDDDDEKEEDAIGLPALIRA